MSDAPRLAEPDNSEPDKREPDERGPAHWTLPSPAPARPVLFGLPPAGRRWPGAARAALAVGGPALIATALGHEGQALLAVVGSFAVLYGEGQAYRRRWKVVGRAAMYLVAAAWLGSLVGAMAYGHVHTGGSRAWMLALVGVMAAVALVATFVVDSLRLGPPGAFFFVMAVEVGALIAGAGVSSGEIALWATFGGLSSLIISMSGVLLRPHDPERLAVGAAGAAVDDYLAQVGDGQLNDAATAPKARRLAFLKMQTAWTMLYDARLMRDPANDLVVRLSTAQSRLSAGIRRDATTDRTNDLDDSLVSGPPVPMPRPSMRYRLARSLTPNGHAAVTAVRVTIAAVIAGSVVVALGVGRPDWAVVTVMLLLHQGPDRVLGTYKGIHRIVGTVLGLLLFGLIYWLGPSGFVLIVVLMCLQFLIELLVVRNYGLAVMFITPLAILIGISGHPSEAPLPVMGDRLIEIAVGAVVALMALWLFDRHAHRRILLRMDGRVLDAAERLLEELSGAARSDEAQTRLRRRLEFELAGSSMAGIDAAHNEPAWARKHWPRHFEIHHLGYRVLAGCWSPGDGGAVSAAELRVWDTRLTELRDVLG